MFCDMPINNIEAIGSVGIAVPAVCTWRQADGSDDEAGWLTFGHVPTEREIKNKKKNKTHTAGAV
jgi:hypothetical protein